MIEYITKTLIVLVLFVILFLIYRSLILREKILSYLKNNYKSVYEEMKLSYSIKDILIGNPNVIKNQLRQNKRLISKGICYDKQISSLQRKYKITILLTLLITLSYIILLVFGLRFILSSWTCYI